MKRRRILLLFLGLLFIIISSSSVFALEACQCKAEFCRSTSAILNYGIFELYDSFMGTTTIDANWYPPGASLWGQQGNIYHHICSDICSFPTFVDKNGYRYTKGARKDNLCSSIDIWDYNELCREAIHGDGIVITDAECLVNNEQCDDGNIISGDGCSVTGQIESGYSCTGTPSVCTRIATCPDGTCSAGEKISSPYCPGDCDISETCGDGVCNSAYGETSLTCFSDCPKTCSLGSNDIIMKLSSPSNAHGALYTDTNYKYDICYSEIFGIYSGGNPHISRNNNKILNLSSTTDAHAEILVPGSYTNNVNYGNLTCSAKATCDEANGEKCVVTISGNTNAHLAACGSANPFATKICCKPYVCVPKINCSLTEEGGKQCGTFTDSCGTERNCDLELGGCQGSYSCVENICTNRVATLWSDIAGISYSSEKVNVVTGQTTVLMNLFNANLIPGAKAVFKVYNGTIEEANLVMTNDTVTITEANKNKINASWTILPENLVNKDLTKAFLFTVNGVQISENPIYLNLIVECTGLISCSGYEDSAKCERDLCNVGNKSVEETLDIVCGMDYGGYKYGCRCAWNSSSNKCGPNYNRIELSSPSAAFSSDWPGSCFFDENIETSCTSDEFMSYSWSGEWKWGKALSAEESIGLETTTRDSKIYYDPLNENDVKESEACTNSVGQKTVPCPSQLKLPFFNLLNMIISLILVAGVYSWMSVRKK